jgi:hypothetical protein
LEEVGKLIQDTKRFFFLTRLFKSMMRAVLGKDMMRVLLLMLILLAGLPVGYAIRSPYSQYCPEVIGNYTLGPYNISLNLAA